MSTRRTLSVAMFAVLAMTVSAQAVDINFSGYKWTIRPKGVGGPGPNNWSASNVFVDANDYLHWKITKSKGKWYCAEVDTTISPAAPTGRLGFGRYPFQTGSRVDQLDPNVVLGLFNDTT